MPKDYKNIGQDKKIRSDNGNKLKYFFAGLAVGLCVAIAVYFYPHKLEQPTGTMQPEIIIKNPEPALNIPNNIPSPSFDFYEILPNVEVNVSEWETEENKDIGKQAKSDNEKTEVYILQIGSFKQYDAANKVKTKLTSMSISAEIQRVVINGKDIRYRVRVGPYVESDKLSMMRQQLAKNNLDYLLLRLK